MKKLISVGLAAAMALGLFAGCAKTDAQPTNLSNAVEYLSSMYKTSGKDQAVMLESDLDVLSSVVVDGVKYGVEWSVEGDAVSIGESSQENHVKIDIPLHPAEDLNFNATATVADEEGNTETLTIAYMVAGADLAGAGMTAQELLEAAYELEEGEAMEGLGVMTGLVTMVNTPYDEGYKNVTVTIVVEGRTDKPIKCYRMKGEGADQVAMGDTISVSGTIKNYNGTIEFDAGCMLDELVKGEPPAPGEEKTPGEIIAEAYALEEGGSMLMPATLTGTIISVDTEFSTQYNNITVTMTVEGFESQPIKCYRLKGTGAETLAVGNVITVTGVLANYKGTVEFGQGCILDEIVS